MPSDHPDMVTAGDLWAPVDKLLRLSVAVPVESMDGLPRTVAPSRNWTFSGRRDSIRGIGIG